MPENTLTKTHEVLPPDIDFFTFENDSFSASEIDEDSIKLYKKLGLTSLIGTMDRHPEKKEVAITDANSIFFYKKHPADKHNTMIYRHSADIISFLESMEEASSKRLIAFFDKEATFYNQIKVIGLGPPEEDKNGYRKHTAFFERTDKDEQNELFSIPAGNIYVPGFASIPIEGIEVTTNIRQPQPHLTGALPHVPCAVAA